MTTTTNAGELAAGAPAPEPRGGVSCLEASGLSPVAVHEAAHAAASVLLLGSVDVVSIRPGNGFHGVTLTDHEAVTREQRELGVVVTLAGDIATLAYGPATTGWAEVSVDEPMARAALDRLPPLARDALLEAETEERIEGGGDEAQAWRLVHSLNAFDDMQATAHLAYLQVVADGFIRRHRHAILAVAAALMSATVIDGSTAAEIVFANRCVCHRSTWTRRSAIKAAGMSPAPARGE